ncbi:MAG: hypothetical protein IPG80_15485 [Anaerolineales bacterium]|uniref:hypothetical protein n=1 Tax=Candidatus Villigracilis vicinus TaxID=3140679 RepID=UPI003136A13E|nr:hypothetical protein [Anaerolineales bacterium]
MDRRTEFLEVVASVENEVGTSAGKGDCGVCHAGNIELSKPTSFKVLPASALSVNYQLPSNPIQFILALPVPCLPEVEYVNGYQSTG